MDKRGCFYFGGVTCLMLIYIMDPVNNSVLGIYLSLLRLSKLISAWLFCNWEIHIL